MKVHSLTADYVTYTFHLQLSIQKHLISFNPVIAWQCHFQLFSSRCVATTGVFASRRGLSFCFKLYKLGSQNVYSLYNSHPCCFMFCLYHSVGERSTLVRRCTISLTAGIHGSWFLDWSKRRDPVVRYTYLLMYSTHWRTKVTILTLYVNNLFMRDNSVYLRMVEAFPWRARRIWTDRSPCCFCLALGRMLAPCP